MPVMSGTIDVVDGVDFRTTLPITGNEKLELHIFTPGQDGIKFIEGYSDTFNIYKIEKIRGTSGTARESMYRIHFVSREAYRNSTTRISKALGGPSSTKLAQPIYELNQTKLIV